METTFLTDTQKMRKILASVKNWLNQHGYKNLIFCRYIRGTYHFDNCQNYMLTAADILENATGLKFTHVSNSMAKLSDNQRTQTF